MIAKIQVYRFPRGKACRGVVDLMESPEPEAIEKERFTPAADKRRQKGVVG